MTDLLELIKILKRFIHELDNTKFNDETEFRIMYMNYLLQFRNVSTQMRSKTKTLPPLVTQLYDFAIFYKEMYKNDDIVLRHREMYSDQLKTYLPIEEATMTDIIL